MNYSIGRPLKGHQATVGKSRNTARTHQGTKLVCQCGYSCHASNMPPSRGGRTCAQDKYREHVSEVLARPSKPIAFTKENTKGEFDEGELQFLNMIWNEKYSNLDPLSTRGRLARDRCILELVEAQEADRSAGDL